MLAQQVAAEMPRFYSSSISHTVSAPLKVQFLLVFLPLSTLFRYGTTIVENKAWISLGPGVKKITNSRQRLVTDEA